MRRSDRFSSPFFFLIIALVLGACEPMPADLTPEDSLEGAQADVPESALQDPNAEQQQQQMSAPLREAERPLPAPNFSLPTLDGGTFTLSNQRGEIVVVNFWATWCGPCRKEIPDFVELQEELGNQGIQFVGISLDDPANEEAVRAFAEEYDINYPIIIDDGSVEEKYGPITALPMTLVVGQQGTGRYFAQGMLSKEVLKPTLIDLLNDEGFEPPPPYPGSG